MMPAYDLLLSGGEVIDPGQGIREIRDVAFASGMVARVEKNISHELAARVIDVRGQIVTPGLIDIHGHYFHSVIPWNVDPDRICLPNGVTTAVDAGSSGCANFAVFRDTVIRQCRTRLYAFINLGALGLTVRPYLPELIDLSLIDTPKTIACINNNRDFISGVKVRMNYYATGLTNALPALERAVSTARETGTRVMVHVSGSPIPLIEISSRLDRGDILSHVFNGHENNIMGWDHRVLPEARAAAEKGIVLDVAHAVVHFDINVARAALEQGFRPDTISTDRYSPTIYGIKADIYDLPEVMSTFLALGMPVEEIVRDTTCNAARVIGRENELGQLRSGTDSDAAVLQLEEGDFTFIDWADNKLKARQRLTPVLTVRNGQVCKLGQA